jgi:hypothetical protein
MGREVRGLKAPEPLREWGKCQDCGAEGVSPGDSLCVLCDGDREDQKRPAWQEPRW